VQRQTKHQTFSGEGEKVERRDREREKRERGKKEKKV
jgi:hypothetical protein